MNRCLQIMDIAQWRTRKVHTDPKRPSKRNCPNCLPMMWKILTTQNRKEIDDLLLSNGLFPEKLRGYRKEERRTGELLYINQHILKKNKTRRKNLAIAWIDDKNAYDTVLPSWIIDCFKIYKISGEIIMFIENTMENRRVELAVEGKSLAEVKIQREISSIEVLFFVIVMTPLIHILSKWNGRYKLSK